MSDYMDVCEAAVRAGGAVLLDKIGRVEVREKGPADLVTEADLASQELISQVLLGAFPDHRLLAEEEQLNPAVSPKASRHCWIVDPLDGTTNYVHGVPHFSVSVALKRDDDLLAGAVYDPVADECFTAVAGGGASLNGNLIRTSNVSTLPESLVAVGLPPAVTRESPDLRAMIEAVTQCQALRRTGSAALNLCYVAAGRFDASWSFSTRVWDIAAGVLLIREAGGYVTAPDGGALVLEEGRFLAAANRPLQSGLLAMLARTAQ